MKYLVFALLSIIPLSGKSSPYFEVDQNLFVVSHIDYEKVEATVKATISFSNGISFESSIQEGDEFPLFLLEKQLVHGTATTISTWKETPYLSIETDGYRFRALLTEESFDKLPAIEKIEGLFMTTDYKIRLNDSSLAFINTWSNPFTGWEKGDKILVSSLTRSADLGVLLINVTQLNKNNNKCVVRCEEWISGNH